MFPDVLKKSEEAGKAVKGEPRMRIRGKTSLGKVCENPRGGEKDNLPLDLGPYWTGGVGFLG